MECLKEESVRSKHEYRDVYLGGESGHERVRGERGVPEQDGRSERQGEEGPDALHAADQGIPTQNRPRTAAAGLHEGEGGGENWRLRGTAHSEEGRDRDEGEGGYLDDV